MYGCKPFPYICLHIEQMCLYGGLLAAPWRCTRDVDALTLPYGEGDAEWLVSPAPPAALLPLWTMHVWQKGILEGESACSAAMI